MIQDYIDNNPVVFFKMKEIYEKTKQYNNIKNIFRYISLEDDSKFMMNTKLRNAREEGIKKNKMDITVNLLKEHIPINIIAKTTGLPCEYIESLEKH